MTERVEKKQTASGPNEQSAPEKEEGNLVVMQKARKGALVWRDNAKEMPHGVHLGDYARSPAQSSREVKERRTVAHATWGERPGGAGVDAPPGRPPRHGAGIASQASSHGCGRFRTSPARCTTTGPGPAGPASGYGCRRAAAGRRSRGLRVPPRPRDPRARASSV